MRLRFFLALIIVMLFLNAHLSAHIAHASSSSSHGCAPLTPPPVPGTPVPAPAIPGRLLINEVLSLPAQVELFRTTEQYRKRVTNDNTSSCLDG